MRLLSRAIFREVALSAFLGTVLFTFVLFLQRVGRFFEILVRASAPPLTVAHLFVLAIPFTFTFAVPMGVLVGVLISLSRMSTDGEITAMRAAGVPSRRVIAPVMACAALATLVTAASSLWLTPYATWKTYRVLNELVAASLTAEVQPRVFEENFPNRIIYIGDVIPGAITRWRNVFIADTTPLEEQKKSDHDRGDGPQITIASDAIAIPDVKRNEIQLSLQNGIKYDVGKDFTDYYVQGGLKGDQILAATKPNEVHARRLHGIGHHSALLQGLSRPHARPRQCDPGAHRAAPAFRAASGLPAACSGRDPAGRVFAQGRQIHGLRRHGRAGIHLLDGTACRQRPGQGPAAAGGYRHVDSERGFRGGRTYSAHPPGAAGRSRHHRDPYRLGFGTVARRAQEPSRHAAP